MIVFGGFAGNANLSNIRSQPYKINLIVKNNKFVRNSLPEHYSNLNHTMFVIIKISLGGKIGQILSSYDKTIFIGSAPETFKKA